MVDLNHGSKCQYRPDGEEMSLAAAINMSIDQGLIAKNQAEPPRNYVSTSGLGRECMRQIQYDYLAVPKDEGGGFSGSTLRIFKAGHYLEDIVADWLRMAGFDLRTQRQDGFAELGGRFKGHIDGVVLDGPFSMAYPALWETKALGIWSFKDVVKQGVVAARPIYAAQIALYQAYLGLPNPALFTAINRDNWDVHTELIPFNAALAQEMSDRAVSVVQTSEREELLPRGSGDREATLCKGGKANGKWYSACSWADRCWGKS